MPGLIRAFVGFMMVFGAVGGMEANPDASMLVLVPLAVLGLAIMASGTAAIARNT